MTSIFHVIPPEVSQHIFSYIYYPDSGNLADAYPDLHIILPSEIVLARRLTREAIYRRAQNKKRKLKRIEYQHRRIKTQASDLLEHATPKWVSTPGTITYEIDPSLNELWNLRTEIVDPLKNLLYYLRKNILSHPLRRVIFEKTLCSLFKESGMEVKRFTYGKRRLFFTVWF